MSFLLHLWLPVVASALVVFALTAASHMVLPWRRGEWGRITEFQILQGALRKVPPGQYMFPAAPEPGQQMTKEWLDRWARGPAGWLTVAPPGPVRMRRNMALSVAAYLAVSFLIAYVTWAALGPAARGRAVFRVVTTVAFLAYGVGTVFESIWYHRPWRAWVSDAVDALLSALATGALFAWMWPT
ncbi:MAG: hypothetical protein WCK73_01115 [Deltaproteobacteria bacterium]